jgi:hypothetical protein
VRANPYALARTLTEPLRADVFALHGGGGKGGMNLGGFGNGSDGQSP